MADNNRCGGVTLAGPPCENRRSTCPHKRAHRRNAAVIAARVAAIPGPALPALPIPRVLTFVPWVPRPQWEPAEDTAALDVAERDVVAGQLIMEDALVVERSAWWALTAASSDLVAVSNIQGVANARAARRGAARGHVEPPKFRDWVHLWKNHRSGLVQELAGELATAEAVYVAAAAACEAPRAAHDVVRQETDLMRQVLDAHAAAVQVVIEGYPGGSAERVAAIAVVSRGFRGTPEDLAAIVAGVCERTDQQPRAGV